jgi:dUTP diphosphatase
LNGVKIQIMRLDSGLQLPRYSHPGDAGLDLFSAEDLTLKPGQRAMLGTGIAVAIPEGYAGFVQPRSGLAKRHGMSLVNSPGLVDSGYRGEIKVIAINHDPDEAIEIKRGDRIAQMVIVPVASAEVIEVAELPESERGGRGFGSTG